LAFTATLALVGGAEVTTGLVLGAMAEVGTAMTIVGAVTGNKALMQIGGVIGLVGGVGGLVSGAVSGAASATGSAIDASGNAVSASGAEVGAANALSDSSYAGANWGAAATEGANSATSGLAAASSGVSGAPDIAGLADEAHSSMLSDNWSPGESGVQAPETPAPAQATSQPSAPSSTSQASGASPSSDLNARNGMDVQSDAANKATYSQNTSQNWSAPQAPKDYFGGFMNWVKNNQLLANGVLKFAGGALQGMNERDMFDKKLGQQQKQFDTLYGHANEVASYKPFVQQAQGG
jgi:hypothetical protein